MAEVPFGIGLMASNLHMIVIRKYRVFLTRKQ